MFGPDADVMGFRPRRPRHQWHRSQPSQFGRVAHPVRRAANKHAPTGSVGRVDTVDLEGDLFAAQCRLKLASGGGPEHHKALYQYVVDGQDCERTGTRVRYEWSEVVAGVREVEALIGQGEVGDDGVGQGGG